MANLSAMKKHLLTYLFLLGILAIATSKANYTADFFHGIIAGAALMFLIVGTLGHFLARKAAERMDKFHRDKMEELQG